MKSKSTKNIKTTTKKVEAKKTVNKNESKTTADKAVEKPEQKKDFWGNLGSFVKKAVDCCLE
jgi:hypothetical protein